MTQTEFARQIGLSYTTISRAFNHHPLVAQKTREAVFQAARELGFQPHTAARGLRLKCSFTVGMILENDPLHFWAATTSAIERGLRAEGYYLVICHRFLNEENSDREIRHLLSRNIDAVIVCPAIGEKPETVQPVLDTGVPLVLLDQPLRGMTAHYLGTNSREGMRQLTEHLLELGHTRLGCISGPASQYTSVQRVEGVQRAVDASGRKGIEVQTLHADGWGYQDGYRSAKEMLAGKNRPTAILAASDRMALATYRAATELGLRIPDDLSVTGYCNEDMGQYVNPPLTTVDQSATELGEQAAARILNSLQNPDVSPRRKELSDRLVIRSSTGPRPA